MAGTTGLEPATSAGKGQRPNQLSYVPKIVFNNLDICHIESSDSQLSLFSTVSLLGLKFEPFWTLKRTPNELIATTRLSLSDLVSSCPLTRASFSYAEFEKLKCPTV